MGRVMPKRISKRVGQFRLFLAALVAGAVMPSLAAAQVAVDWVDPTAGVAIAVDSANNVYTLDYVYALGAEMILTKRDVDGNFTWNASYDQTDMTKWERASWVATDSADNVIVTGTLMSGYSNPVEAASIVMKFDSAGHLLWRRVYESSFDGSYTKKCLVDGNDNVYVLGTGSGPAGYVTKVKKFSPDGDALWSYLDADGIGLPLNFKFTPDAQLTITGRSVFGSVNGYARIDQDGHKVWSYPGVLSLTTGDADGDDLGNTYLVNGEYVFNGGTVVTKLDATGALLWNRTFALGGLRVEVGTDNRPVVSGFPNPNTAGAAFIKVDENGGLVWENLDADGPLALLLHAHMLLDASNDAYLAAGTLFEMAVCKVKSDGTSSWTQTTTGGYANAIALSKRDNSVFVVGGDTARLLDETRDLDGDGVYDGADNCTEIANPDQADPNADGFGTACDFDLNDDCSVNFADLGELKAVFFTNDAEADFDGDGAVNFGDLGRMKGGFFLPPGPSGVPNLCNP